MMLKVKKCVRKQEKNSEKNLRGLEWESTMKEGNFLLWRMMHPQKSVLELVSKIWKMGFLALGDEVAQHENPGGAASSSRGNEAPVTPVLIDDDSGQFAVPTTPRASPTTRLHDEGDDDVDIEEHQNKRLKPEDPKRARIQRIATEYSAKINSVQFRGSEFHTMDNYDDDLDLEKPDETLELWAGEDDLQFNDVPEDLWSNFNMEQQPEEPPAWVDVLANELEISRLTSIC